jgi:DNA-binding NtrC family response regulator
MSTILVVDDNDLVRDSLSQILENEKYTVLTAENGNDALEVLKKEKPDIVLLDLRMPEMDGIEFLKTWKKTIGSRLHIIVLTGNADEEEANQCLKEFPIHAFLEKPVRPTELKSQIQSAIKNIEFNETLYKMFGIDIVLKVNFPKNIVDDVYIFNNSELTSKISLDSLYNKNINQLFEDDVWGLSSHVSKLENKPSDASTEGIQTLLYANKKSWSIQLGITKSSQTSSWFYLLKIIKQKSLDTQDRPRGRCTEKNLQEALNESNWNISSAANKLGINRSTVHRKMKKFNMQKEM